MSLFLVESAFSFRAVRKEANDSDLVSVVKEALALSPIGAVQITLSERTPDTATSQLSRQEPRKKYGYPPFKTDFSQKTDSGPQIALKEAAQALVDRLDLIHNDPLYRRAWELAQLADGPYEGPNYHGQLKVLRALLEKTTLKEKRVCGEDCVELSGHAGPCKRVASE